MDTLSVMIGRVQNYHPMAGIRQHVMYIGKMVMSATGTDLIG